jgi:hypothetical protein
MEKIPQIVTERLRAIAVTAEHPSADVLTAFSERSLHEVERATVLDHLARCAECREVVALALPATEPAQPVLRPAPKNWLSWPALRWGLVAAGVLIVGSFAIVQYQRQHTASTMAYSSHAVAEQKESTGLPAAPQSQQQPMENRDKAQAAATVPALTTPAERAQGVARIANLPSAKKTVSAPGAQMYSSGAAVGGVIQSGPRVQWQNTNQQVANNLQSTQPLPAPALSAAKQIPSGGPTRMAQAQSADENAQMVAEAQAPVLESQSIAQQSSNGGSADSKVEKAKPAGSALINPSKVIVREMEAPTVAAGARISTQLATTSPVRWTINTAGGLQRSFDQGSTWQDVDVSSSAPPAAESMTLMKAPKAKEKEMDAIARKDTALPIVFRAVAANGLDVWAGASGGLLYHSADAGGQWTRVVPSASGVSLTGDIVSLEFIDPQHGRVTTSTPEAWTTSDAGHSWQRQ